MNLLDKYVSNKQISLLYCFSITWYKVLYCTYSNENSNVCRDGTVCIEHYVLYHYNYPMHCTLISILPTVSTSAIVFLGLLSPLLTCRRLSMHLLPWFPLYSYIHFSYSVLFMSLGSFWSSLFPIVSYYTSHVHVFFGPTVYGATLILTAR